MALKHKSRFDPTKSNIFSDDDRHLFTFLFSFYKGADFKNGCSQFVHPHVILWAHILWVYSYVKKCRWLKTKEVTSCRYHSNYVFGWLGKRHCGALLRDNSENLLSESVFIFLPHNKVCSLNISWRFLLMELTWLWKISLVIHFIWLDNNDDATAHS